MRALIVVLLMSSCATTPAYVYDLADAQNEEQRASAIETSAALVQARPRPVGLRMAAARTLGRLRSADQTTVAALRQTLFDSGEPEQLRAYAAWALGELRSGASLTTLKDVLRQDVPPLVAEHVLEALAKHYAVMSADHETLVEIVEALVYFAGNHRGGSIPATYDLLSANTRTLPVNVEVLERALEQVKVRGTDAERAAMYSAAYELLTRLEGSTAEIVAGPNQWAGRVNAAVSTTLKALDAEDPRTALLVVWYLGQLASVPEVGAPAAKGLLAHRHLPTRSERERDRLVATWALARMQVHAVGARRALLLDILSKELEPRVLDLCGDVSAGPGELDLLQKILGLGAQP